MWIKKHAPTSFDDFVGNSDLVHRFKTMAETRYLQHMILCGPSGIGKVHLLKMLIDKLLGPFKKDGVLEFTSADERSNQVIREKIHQFVPKKIETDVPKFVILRQAQCLSEGSQQIMRRLMERHYHHTVFVFLCTSQNGILETLQSRCHIFHFKPITIEQQTPYLEKILQAEGIEYEPGAAELIGELSNGDMRAAINYLQTACCMISSPSDKTKPTLTVTDIQTVCIFPHYRKIKSFFEIICNLVKHKHMNTHEHVEQFKLCVNIIKDFYEQGYCSRDIIHFLTSYLSTNADQIPRLVYLSLVKEITVYHHRIMNGTDSYAQLLGIVAGLYKRALELSKEIEVGSVCE